MVNPIHKDEFPRERLIKYTAEYLNDYELLAIILNTGTKKENVLELSKRITTKVSLQTLARLKVAQLRNQLRIGEAKACTIAAIAELSRRIHLPEEDKPTIKTAKEAADLLMPLIGHQETEQVVAMYLNSRRKLIKIQTLFSGSLNQSLINSREIFKAGLELGASAVILAHNHPSGDKTPSLQDITTTRALEEAGKIMQIPVLDHIIIVENDFYSLKESDELNKSL